MNFLIILSIICSFTIIIQQINTQSAILGEWEKCGGIDFPPDLTCSEPFTCIYFDEWYSQCQYRKRCRRAQPRYSQCGGKEYTGRTVCCQGLECIFVTDYWSHCQLKLTP